MQTPNINAHKEID